MIPINLMGITKKKLKALAGRHYAFQNANQPITLSKATYSYTQKKLCRFEGTDVEC